MATGRRLTPLIHRSISRVGNSKPSLHSSSSFPPSPRYLSVSCSSRFMLGISTSRRSSSGGRSLKRPVLDPSGQSPTSFTPTITAVAPHTWQRYVLFLFSRDFTLAHIVTNYSTLTSISKAITSLFLNSRVIRSLADVHLVLFRDPVVLQSICGPYVRLNFFFGWSSAIWMVLR